MKFKGILIILFFCIFADVYSAIETFPVSPYVDRGVSFEYQLSYNPVTITHYYESKTQNNLYSAYQNNIYLQEDSKNHNGYIKIGNRKEKLEILVSFWLFPRITANARIKVNHINIGEDKLFKNLAISYFGGITGRFFIYKENNMYAEDKSVYMFYSGASLGTSKKIDEFSYFEIFTSPQFLLTCYNLGGKFDPKNMLLTGWDYNGKSYKTFGLWMPEFTVPIGVGIKYRNVFVKGGIAFSTTIGGKTRNLDRPDTFLDKVVVDTQNFSFFLNAGIHFRKFSELEKKR